MEKNKYISPRIILDSSKKIMYIKNGLSSRGVLVDKEFVLSKLKDKHYSNKWEDLYKQKDLDCYLIHRHNDIFHITIYLDCFECYINKDKYDFLLDYANGELL